jgi:hypothetical protein
MMDDSNAPRIFYEGVDYLIKDAINTTECRGCSFRGGSHENCYAIHQIVGSDIPNKNNFIVIKNDTESVMKYLEAKLNEEK